MLQRLPLHPQRARTDGVMMDPVRFLALSTLFVAAPAMAQEQEPAQPSPPPEVETVPVQAEPERAAPANSDATQLETIEVTSTKRAKAQRDIPGSVGAIRGEELEKMRAQGMKDYLKLVPGVTLVDQGNDTSVPVIRGIASELGFGFTGQVTGIYLDDMPFADLILPQSLPDLNPFDLERVEVLKGPQGTLFGSGALAGAVRYITHKPDHGVWNAKVQETLSETHDGGGIAPVTAGAVNVPLFGDAVALRGVALFRKDPGLYDMSAHDQNGNTLRDDKDADKLKQDTWRVLGSWNPLDDLKLSAFWFSQKTHTDDLSLADNPREPTSDNVPFPTLAHHDFGGGNLLATYDFGWGSLLSSTNRMTKSTRQVAHQELLLDQTQQNSNEFIALLAEEVRGITQEIRLASPETGDAHGLTWLVGTAYMKYDAKWFEYEPEYGPVPAPRPESPNDVSTTERAQSFLFATVNSTAYEEALFGEVTQRLGDHWEVTAAARKYKTKLVADTALSGSQIVALSQKPEDDEHFEPVAKGVNPKFAIRYLHNRNVQVYALAAKGFQFGGVQLNPPFALFVQGARQAGFNFGPYNSSKLWNYESGVRTEWLDRRLRFDVAMFYMDWRDLQLTVEVPDPATGTGLFAMIANVGRAHSAGVEAALEMIPFDGAKWATSATWINAVTDELFDTANSDGGVKPGTRLPGTPRFAWSTVASYEHVLPYFDSWSAGPVLTYAYTGDAPNAIRPDTTIGGYATLDARVALTQASRFQPELSLGVNNVFDTRGVTLAGVNNSVSGTAYPAYHFVQPRTAVLSLSLRY